MRKPRALFSLIGPGVLVAATGVGAGDLYTAGFAGQQLGHAVLWAVVVGAFLKFVLNEGLARFQLATGETLLEGCVGRIGLPFQLVFGVYLVGWSFFVGAALMSACGVTLHALVPSGLSGQEARLVYGLGASLAGVLLVRIGGYRLFTKLMAVCIALMFVAVLLSAVLLGPSPAELLEGLLVPRIPELDSGGLGWTLALLGGVGGTLTVICYGYWLREEGRETEESLRVTRIDLAIGYALTMLFGLAMVSIGSSLGSGTGIGTGTGATFIVSVADALEGQLGPTLRWLFLAGAFGAVFSSLLGVWQSVPYVFADFLGLCLKEREEWRRERVSTSSRSYRFYLYALALLPALSIWQPFREVQKLYAVLGACFMPFLALVLLYLNGSARHIGERHRNRLLTNLALLGALALFGWFAWLEMSGRARAGG